MNGEFIGGCDILLEMHKSGDFIEELKKVGIESALLTEKKEAEWMWVDLSVWLADFVFSQTSEECFAAVIRRKRCISNQELKNI